MTDRRRKRKTNSSFADDTVKDFNAVDPIQIRRSSDWGDQENGIRHESWMTKVSLAMSSRIFSGGKKLSGSRSTQVMPVAVVVNDSSRTSAGRVSSSSVSSWDEMELQRTPSTSFSNRPVALEKALINSTESFNASSQVSTFAACQSVACDVAPEDSDDSLRNEDRSRWSSHSSAPHRCHRGTDRRQRSSSTAQKVRPRDGDHEDDEEKEGVIISMRTRVTSIPTGTMRSRGTCVDDNAEVNVQDAAPILKGFFSKSVTVSKEQRQQQREQKREALYRDSKQRQDKLREQIERERGASEESSRKRKVEQLRRLNQQRKMELRRDAASARKVLVERIQDDNDMYLAERRSWEHDFEDEMMVLNAAFRKARTSDENRPMTVAGLAVPEAISQLERDASNYEKRVKTADPALGAQRSPNRPSTSADRDLSRSLFFESCEVLAIEDSKDVFELFGGDDKANDLFPSKASKVLVQQPDPDINQLLGEREVLLQRVAVIDRTVQAQQQQ